MRLALLSVVAAVSFVACSNAATTEGNNEAGVEGAIESAPRQGPYPAEAVFDAFRNACGDVKSFADAENRVAQLGWTPVQRPSDSPIGGLATYMNSPEYRASLAEINVQEAGASFREKIVAGERLYLLISALRSARGNINGCRMLDPHETEGLTVADVARFLDREPSETGQDETGSAVSWTPGFSEDQPRLELIHANPNSEAAISTGASGFAIRTNQLER